MNMGSCLLVVFVVGFDSWRVAADLLVGYNFEQLTRE